jgi:type VI secretion system protein ImpI
MPLRLRIISDNRKLLGNKWTKEFAACGGTIGRNQDNDWILPDAHRYVSGRHALIDFQGGAYYLVDTSRNGVYINGAGTPVARGHPQRIFDGDQLRIGDFDILTQITDGDEDILDDGMRDSVVRAQLVEIDDSAELPLMDEQQLDNDESLSAHLISDDSARLSEINTILPTLVPGREAQAAAARKLLEAGGLNADDMAGIPPEEVLETSGKLLRLLVDGLMDLLQDRARIKENFRLSQTAIRAEPNNPLKFSPSVADALRYLLGNRSESYLTPEVAVRNVLQDIKMHEKAVVGAMQQALTDYLDRFDPHELRSQFDRGLKRSSLLAGTNKLKYWELYEESYQVLTHRQDGKMPAEFGKEFAEAYEDQISQARQKPTTN